MALLTSGATALLSPAQVNELVVQPVINEAVSAQVATVVRVASHDLRVPIVTQDPSASFVAEGAEIPVTDSAVTEQVVTPKKLAALSIISSELANDSSPAALQVVGEGIVRDVKTAGVVDDPGLQVYLPINQVTSTSVAVVVRARVAPASLRGALEAALHSLDPNLPVYDVRTMEEVIGRGVGQQRLTMVLLLGFAALSLVMAAVGVFGVILVRFSFSAAQSTELINISPLP